ncbi:hypothetical protein M011DRAFT_521194 [Sporormia fimetaria CBS 119925]|uniref:Uncharacterized protein n=1 Tax=Sporormia fimetaria CBS 119925 TaxID=1340428 RepID=A0A6A6V0K0_9PLEO|nr:hypothetical protein M011DRAFT_521194 [Sporormia fimetaria CBS 119925]
MGPFDGLFNPTPVPPKVSRDTIDHAPSVMACRFGWSLGADSAVTYDLDTPLLSLEDVRPRGHISTPSASNRFVNCRGRLYHQLNCSHRIRTDIVEDCGSNCLEPYDGRVDAPFCCHECMEMQAKAIWDERQARHNALYPPRDQMTNEQHERWVDEHRQLRATFINDRNTYEAQVRANTRPSNVCSVLEVEPEEMIVAMDLDNLSLVRDMPGSSGGAETTSPADRRSLPTDASEQLHWHLSSLALGGGQCGVEYSQQQPSHMSSTAVAAGAEDLWKRKNNNG